MIKNSVQKILTLFEQNALGKYILIFVITIVFLSNTFNPALMVSLLCKKKRITIDCSTINIHTYIGEREESVIANRRWFGANNAEMFGNTQK